MKKQKHLTIEMAIFAFLIFVAFGVIIVTEKAGDLMIPKVQTKIDSYIKENYKNEEVDFKKGQIKHETAAYTMKVKSKDNKNLYFYINYSNNKISDTYKKDYLKGKTLLNYLEKNIQKEINNNLNIKCEVEIINTLDEYTDKVRERIVKEDNLLELKFYIIKNELIIDTWNTKEITKSINNFISTLNTNNINPKYYKITITNKNDITQSIEISNINSDFITNPYQEQIINDIINDNNSKLLKEFKITYKYLN